MSFGAHHKVFLIGKESTYGTAVTQDKDIGIITDVQDNLSRELIPVPSVGTTTEQSIETGAETHGHNITLQYQHGRIIEYFAGGVAHAETTGDWKHTFTVNNTTNYFSSQSGESASSDTGIELVSNAVESIDVNIELNGLLTMNIVTKAKSVVDDSSNIGTHAISALPVFPHALVAISINGSSASEVQNFSIKMNATLGRSDGVGSTTPQQMHQVSKTFEFSGKLGFANSDYQNIMVNDTEHAIIFNATNGITLGSGLRQFYCSLQGCHFDKFDKITTVGNLTFVDISGKGLINELYSVDNISSSSW